jgi:hypothetical protein
MFSEWLIKGNNTSPFVEVSVFQPINLSMCFRKP